MEDYIVDNDELLLMHEYLQIDHTVHFQLFLINSEPAGVWHKTSNNSFITNYTVFVNPKLSDA